VVARSLREPPEPAHTEKRTPAGARG